MEIQMIGVAAIRTSSLKQLPPPKNDFAKETCRWTTPRIVAIGVGQEINDHACAELN